MSEHVNEDSPVVPRQITDEQLLEVSDFLWGSTDYGVTAVSLLDITRRYADATAWSIDNAGLNLNSEKRSAATLHTEQRLREMCLDQWDLAHYPFEPHVRYCDGIGSDALHPAFSITESGLLTRLRLADFSRSRGYHRHKFHGTFGKTFDVLAVASGLKKARKSGSSHVETDFITANDLRAHLRSLGLPQRYRNEINSELLRAASDAVYGTKSDGNNKETIFEGIIKNPGASGQKFDRVAVPSLVAMADRFAADRPTALALRALAK